MGAERHSGPVRLEVDVPTALADAVGTVDVAVVLGSGLSGYADGLEGAKFVPYSELAGFPDSGFHVAGHSGRLALAEVGGASTVFFQGRVHSYQGFGAVDAAYPARLAAALGATKLIVTNAAGGINRSFAAGDLMLITDQLNLTGDSPLIGWPGPEGGTPFVPMSDAYSPRLAGIAREAAAEVGVGLREGVYAGLRGPAYETPAEVRMLGTLGADAVGMSTVPEVIAARALGLEVLGISLISNVAAAHDISHEEVLEAGQLAAGAMSSLLTAILFRLSP